MGIVYIFSCLFTFCHLIVYIFSCLFTFLSAEISCLFTSCQLIFEFLRQNHGFLVTFLPLQMLQHFNCKLKKKLFCLHFQLFVYNFSCLFTFCQLIVYIFSCLFTISAVCLPFCQLKSAVCLLLVS